MVHRVVLVCGLPGAGKSTLCRRIAAQQESSAHFNNHVRIIEYDQLESSLLLSLSLQSSHPPLVVVSTDPVEDEKEEKEENNPDPTNSISTLKAWHVARKMALVELKQHILNSSITNNSGAGGSSSSSPSLLTILDDNFYLRSMRKDVNRTLQECYHQMNHHHHHHQNVDNDEKNHSITLLFGTIFVDVPLHICLERNATRPCPIDPTIIHRMYKRMEVPGGPTTAVVGNKTSHDSDDDDYYYWDQCTFRLEYSQSPKLPPPDTTTTTSTNNNHHQCQNDAVDWITDAQWEALKEFVQYGLKPIAFPKTNDKEQKVQPQLTLAQRRDVYWRSCVATIGRQWPYLAPLANQARRHCLKVGHDATLSDFLQKWPPKDQMIAIRSVLAELGDPPIV